MITLTKQEFEEYVAASNAAKAGKPWQYRIKLCTIWTDSTPNTTPPEVLMQLGFLCRPVPDPEHELPQPWDCPDDVPGPVCWLRGREGAGLNQVERLITTISHADELHIQFSHGGGLSNFNKWEYSTDRKTWKPCVKVAK